MRKRLLKAATAAVTAAAIAGVAAGVVRRRRIAAPGAGEDVAFGSLKSTPLTVTADDGVPLHAEVDEATSDVTLVFVHGFSLSLDCWHFQRAGYRGHVRSVFYDQRSHGLSGRSPRDRCTIDQLGRDLGTVLAELAPAGPVVLVGHSMGGMSIVSLAAQHPELFGPRVVGVALIGTTAGGLKPGQIVAPLFRGPRGIRLADAVVARAVSGLARGSSVVDLVRRFGGAPAEVIMKRFAFGEDAPRSYVQFLERLLDGTPFTVIADFFPAFETFDSWAALDALSAVPVTIIHGGQDRVIGAGHARKLSLALPAATLVECPEAGHMVLWENHDQVNAALDLLITGLADGVA